MTSPAPQSTDFTKDVLGRYVCNGLDEALRSADPAAARPDGSPQSDARPFDVIVIGGGTFGPLVAQHVYAADTTHSHRVLVLEAGPMSLPEHVQNLPMVGLGVPPAATTDPGPRSEVWGLPWRSDLPFPGLAYTVGGRSLYWGGWAPQPVDAELTGWPAAVVSELRGPAPDGSDGYFRQAAAQLGVTETNDFVFGALHEALRHRLFEGIGRVRDAIPLDSPDQLEAPLSVQGRAPRSGYFPLNKFSSVPLVMQASRGAAAESAGDDVKKRFMIVPNCHVIRLLTEPTPTGVRVAAVLTNGGTVQVPAGARVVLATGAVESTRLVLTSFPELPNAGLIGTNLMVHLRSNLTIRIPRSSLPADLGAELQASALFMKGRHGASHFHLQISAAGLETPIGGAESELFKKNPDIDLFDRFRTATDTTVVITIRGVGEMQPDNPASRVTLSQDIDEYEHRRAHVAIQATATDLACWDVMDAAADEVALVLAAGLPYEVFLGGGANSRAYAHAAAHQPANALLPFAARRDGLGTTHHESGTLWMGGEPAGSVTDPDGRLHGVDNAFVAGPALFPTVGSTNPGLTGVALARRLADTILRTTAFAPDPGFHALFDGSSVSAWRMSTIRNQPGHADPGRFVVVDAGLESVPGNDLGLLWHTEPTPADFVLRLEWRRWRDDDNSGVLFRFPHPDGKAYDNTAYVATDFGFEVQIDQLARPDGAPVHLTGALYGVAPPAAPHALPVLAPGEWNRFEIIVQGQSYDVILNGVGVTHYENPDPDRGRPSQPGAPAFVGLQTHTGRVGFRHIQLSPL